MNAIIRGKPDNLDQLGQRFQRARLTTPVFLNSVPKAGTHLLRNIFRMFVAEEQHWKREFIQHAILRHGLPAFSAETPHVSWGHLLFSDDAAIALRDVRHVVLVRDPYDWVLARARFYLSDEFEGPLRNVRGGAASVEDILNMMIMGVHDKVPSLSDIYTFNAAAWMTGRTRILQYETVVANVRDLGARRAEAFFGDLMDFCGVALPDDWRERVEVGSDRRESRTARENLKIDVDIPDVLPEQQRRLVDFHAPGLRALLGYA